MRAHSASVAAARLLPVMAILLVVAPVACSLLAPSDSQLLCEIDTSADPHNCGACGHACAAGLVCTAGVCGGVGSDGGRGPDGGLDGGPVNLTGVACGGAFSCALYSDGSVRCWGANESGELGIGSDSALPTPTPGAVVTAEGPLRGATALALGARHACAVDAEGAVNCWGAGQRGQLGAGAGVTQSSVARPVVAPGGLVFAAIGAGDLHTCASTASSPLYCWGADGKKQLGIKPAVATVPTPTPVAFSRPQTTLALGTLTTCAVVGADKSAYCWGANDSGQLAAAAVATLDIPPAPEVTGVTMVAAGAQFACATTVTGGAECWGDNSAGQLAHKPLTAGDAACATGPCNPKPSAVPGLPAVKQVAAGSESACALGVDGTVWCWGADDKGQLGHGTTDPDKCAVDAGTGDGGTTPCDAAPTQVKGVAGASAIACGTAHCCALASGGEVTCWGAAASGQIGTTVGAGPNVVQGLR